MAFNVEPSGGGGGRRIGTSLAEINIVPLVDVVLVLLLIFMLTAPMMYRGIDVNLPRAAAKPTAVEERLVLTVTKDRTLFLNDRRITPGGLEGSLRDAFRNRTDKTLYLKADAGLVRRRRRDHGHGPPRRHRAPRHGHRAGPRALTWPSPRRRSG
jgi:biopolymer transport protein ExbD